ncbi:hypothetical protein PsorP6_004549 [Peronosclerospora sorghi]|uniref:Uncharacterized protein n=1 Tax=Peronosclerospora sorghi TaxID=230839 RepID=A0ACC0VMZ6_9STRA|nr:hypothetical protein PsorP6_004549 [Peronosclerospora sorghi]
MSLRRNGARIRKALEVCDLATASQQLVRNSPPLRVLGLDVNTNSTGFAIVTEHGRLCRWGSISTAHIASSSVLDIGATVDDFLATVQDAEEHQDPAAQWIVGIEAFMRMFRPGRFHNAGMFQLAQLNGIVSFACWKRFHAVPIHTHPSAARGFFGLSTSSGRSKEGSIKHQVMAFLQEHEAEAVEDTVDRSDALPTLERTRTGALADSAFDIADAYVIAAYTRCVYLQKQLEVQDPDQVVQFTTRYLDLTYEAAAKTKKSSREGKLLKDMEEKERKRYMRDLYAFGVAKWVKEHHDTCFQVPPQDEPT